MKTKAAAVRRFWALKVMLLFLVQICPLLPASAQSKATQITKPVHLIAVMPFLNGRDATNPKETLDCVLSRLFFDSETVLEESDHKLTSYVYEELNRRYGAKVAPLDDVKAAYKTMTRTENEDTLRTLAVRLGQLCKADVVVAGNVWRYRKRSVDSAGAEVPSSVAFAVYLIETGSGKVVWREKFQESQRGPTEEGLDIREMLKTKGKWLSADELARKGVKKVFKRFPI
jgi:hypothetical protein